MAPHAGLLLTLVLLGLFAVAEPAAAQYQNRRAVQSYQRQIMSIRQDVADRRAIEERAQRQAQRRTYTGNTSSPGGAATAVGLLGAQVGRMQQRDSEAEEAPPRPLTQAEKVQMLHRQAAGGELEAHLLLAQMYRVGHWVAVDLAKAALHDERAAELGHLPSMREAAGNFYNGEGVPVDVVRAARWFMAAADKGDAESQYITGVLHAMGEGVPQDDAKAVAWYRRAAEAGSVGGQQAMGIRHLDGKGVAQSDAQALAWFRRAADKGYAPAQFNLATLYSSGRGVPKNDESRATAATWYAKAAEQGYADAQYMMGLMHATGTALPRDLRRAEHFWQQAAAQGDEESLRMLEGLRKHVAQHGYGAP